MTALDVGDLLIIGGGLAFVLRWPAARNRRAALTLGMLTGVYALGSVMLAGPAEGIVKIGVIWAYVLIVLRLPNALGMNTAADVRTDRALRSVFTTVNDALNVWKADPGLQSWSRTAGATEAALERLDAIGPVDRRWEPTVVLVRRYLRAVQDAANAYDPDVPQQLPRQVTGPALAALIAQIDETWQAAQRR